LAVIAKLLMELTLPNRIRIVSATPKNSLSLGGVGTLILFGGTTVLNSRPVANSHTFTVSSSDAEIPYLPSGVAAFAVDRKPRLAARSSTRFQWISRDVTSNTLPIFHKFSTSPSEAEGLPFLDATILRVASVSVK
jgi:hypothetical protein